MMASLEVPSSIHSPLQKDGRQIRLLIMNTAADSSCDIECRIHIFDMAVAPAYEALSYRWGDASVTQSISVDGHLFQATTNLVSALRRLRERGKSKYLWIDAICINQSSIEEKNLQVPLMGAIYSQAVRVLIWLGEESTNSGSAIALLHRWADAIDEARKVSEKDLLAMPLTSVLKYAKDPFDETGRDALAALVQRSYWQRVWIVQEIVLAKTRMILCGKDEIHYDRFHHAYDFFQDLLYLNSQENQIDPDMVSRMGVSNFEIKSITLAILQKAFHKRSGGRSKERALRVIQRASHCQATDPRDKVYGMLGLFGDSELDIKPDYSLSPDQVNIAFVKAEIQASQRLDGLAFAGVGDQQKKKSLPTWVFDVSRGSDQGGAFLAETLEVDGREDMAYKWDAAGAVEARFSFPSIKTLQARGFVCDYVGQLSQANITMPWAEMEWIWKWLSLAKSAEVSPYNIPWRRAFFLAIMADEFSFGPDKPGFISTEKETQFYRQIEASMSMMRYLALKIVRDRLYYHTECEQDDLPEMLPMAEDSSPYINRLQTLEDVDDEVIYWAQNSSATSDPAVRKERLDAFCGESESLSRLEWPLEEYGCLSSAQGFNIMLTKLRVYSAKNPFFISRRGYMGLLPPAAEESDLVCCLYGCAVPLIVRKTPEGTILIGEAYVYGMMWGEMVDGTREGMFHEEDFIFI